MRKHQALLHLQNDVRDFRTRQAPQILADLKSDREHAGLSAADWDAFKLDYVGPVDSLLTDHISRASRLISELQGPARTDPAVQENPDPTIALIPADATLADQSLSLLSENWLAFAPLWASMHRMLNAMRPCRTKSPRPRPHSTKFSSRLSVPKALMNAYAHWLMRAAAHTHPFSRPSSRKRKS